MSFEQVSLSAVSSGATIDTKFDPSGSVYSSLVIFLFEIIDFLIFNFSDKLLVGCARNEGATGDNFSMLFDLTTGWYFARRKKC